MQMRLMATDGGSHPPETLAGMTAQRIIDDFAVHAPEAAYAEVMAFRDTIDRIMTAHHRLVQEAERSALQTEGPARLIQQVDTHVHIPDALDDIMAAAKEKVDGKPKWPTLMTYFARPETQQYLEDVLHMELHQNMHIERSWHADANPEDPHAVAFNAIRANGHGLLNTHDDDLKPHGGRELLSAMVRNSIPYSTPKAEGQ
jgi:hypothetical protein